METGVFEWSEQKKEEKMRALIFGFVLLSVCGCATVKVVDVQHLNEQRLTPAEAPVAHVYVTNWGWYLFKYIPFFTGDLDDPGALRWPVFGTDNVRVEDLVEKVTEKSKDLGATTTTDLRTRDRSKWLPYTLIFWLNEIEVSANASRASGAAGQP